MRYIISVPAKEGGAEDREKMEAFVRLEASRKAFGQSLDYDKEREEAMDAKYSNE